MAFEDIIKYVLLVSFSLALKMSYVYTIIRRKQYPNVFIEVLMHGTDLAHQFKNMFCCDHN